MVLPSTLRVIGGYTFYCCRYLRSVEFREGSRLERIGQEAFYECRSLRHINLPEGLRRIESECFFHNGLEEITIPSSITTLGDYAFCLCYDLKRMIFQSGSELEQIHNDCFSSNGLEEFVAPPGLRRIESGAFSSCCDMVRVVLNEGLEKIGDQCKGLHCSGAFGSIGVKEITLPSTLKQIDMHTFKDCDSLRTIYVRNDCKANLSQLIVPASAQVVRLSD